MSNLDIAGYNRKGTVFGAANVSAKSHIAVTTSMTGAILYNPAGSNKKLVMVHCGFAYTTAPAALHNIGLALASPNVTVPSSLTAIGSGVVALDGSGSGGASVARAYDAATLPVAPTAVRWFAGAIATGGTNTYQISENIDGAIVLVPGAVLCTTVVTTTAVGMASFAWIEVPV